jgi:transmembrane sensor
MKSRLDRDDAGPPCKASEWLTALLERPDDHVLHERFHAWLSADPGNAADWAEIARTYEVMGRTQPTYREQWLACAATRDKARPLPIDRRSRPAVRWRLPRAAMGFAALAIAACLVLAVAPDILLRLTADHVTATAETRTVRLADGSVVRLGPESAIDVAYAGSERGIRLLQGRAFFEVVPDPARPFRVRTELVDTTVLGTAFEVRLDERGADVAVRRGLVRVAGSDGAPLPGERLKADDWVRMARSGEVTRGTRPSDQVAPWLHGLLIAKDRPVGEVVAELRRYYRGTVILHGDRLAEQPLTGVYDLSDPVAALKAVASALGATPYQISPWVFVIAGG